MINFRELRFWTALLTIGFCLLTISWALPVLRYGLASLVIDANSAPARLAPLKGEAIVGPAVERDLLTVAPPSNVAARVDSLTALLGDTPLSAGAWLDLAIARAGAGAPVEQVANALALSSLTGPNEARFMAGRASFGLPLWSKWPPSVRQALIGDLVGGWSEMDATQRADLDAVLTVESDRTREEIRAALLLNGDIGASIIEALELQPETPAVSDGARPTTAR